MNRLVPSLVLLLIASALTYGQSPNGKAGDALKQHLIQLENEWQKPTLDLDRAKQLMADDWVCISNRGEVSDKAKELADWGVFEPYDAVGISEINVRLYGKVAVITSLVTNTFKNRFGAHTIKRRLTDVWVKNKVGWQVVSTHNSPVVMPQQSQ